MAGQQDPTSTELSRLTKPELRLLRRSFFDRDPREVAVDLLGRIVESHAGDRTVRVRLTEVEAYLGEGEDPASHSFRGLSPRNAVMFGPPGHVYTYFTYGMHWCANLVCRPSGVSGGVLLRAGAVVDGLDVARERRPKSASDAKLGSGPARLATVLGLERASNGADACSATGLVRVLTGRPSASSQIAVGPRVGVNGAGAPSPWRWWVDGDPSVSAFRPGKPRRRPTGVDHSRPTAGE